MTRSLSAAARPSRDYTALTSDVEAAVDRLNAVAARVGLSVQFRRDARKPFGLPATAPTITLDSPFCAE